MGCCRCARLDGVNVIGYALIALSTLVNIPVAGFIQSFGVFVKTFDKYYCPGDCLQLLGWIAALPYAINLMICLIVVKIQHVMGDRWPFVIGVVLSAGSLIATSYVNEVNIMFGTYCILYGIGSSLVMYVPFAVLDYHFPEEHPRHVLATSIVNLGAPIGVFIMNPLASYLEHHERFGDNHAGWRYALRTFAIAICVLGIPAVAVMNRPSRKKEYDEVPEESQPFFSTAFLRSFYPLSLTWILTITLISYGVFIPKIHFINYMSSTLNVTEEKAAEAIGYEGLAETMSTLAVSLLGTLLSRKLLYFYLVGSASLAVASGLLLLATAYVEVVIYCVVHGVMDGFLMTLTFPVIGLIAREPEQRDYIWGMTQLGIGLGQLIGLPMTGLTFDLTKSYNLTFIICAAIFSVAFLLVTGIYYASRYEAKKKKMQEDLKQLEDPADAAERSPIHGIDNPAAADVSTPPEATT